MAKGGEQSAQGTANTELFSELIQKFGWVQRGPRDENIECLKCSLTTTGKRKHHGIDLLFTFDCPYENRTRGIYVDGKRYSMQSATKDTIKKWLAKTKLVTDHLSHSQSGFAQARQLPTDTKIDTGIIEWDCHEGWEVDAATSRLNEVSFYPSNETPLLILLLTKTHLNRLASVVIFRDKQDQLEFLYNPERQTTWSEVLTPELMASELWCVRYKCNGNNSYNHGVFYFPDGNISDINFLVPYLSHMQMLTHDHVDVYVPCQKSQLETYQSLLDAQLKAFPGNATVVKCNQLTMCEFQS